MRIVTVNAGSSSLKVAYFQTGARTAVGATFTDSVWSAEIEWNDDGHGVLKVEGESGGTQLEGDHEACVEQLFARLWAGENAVITNAADVEIVGHRVVHGGKNYTKAVEVTDDVLKDLRKLIELAPSHEPINIEGIELTRRVFPKAKQVAVFDTAFHHTMPESSSRYPVPAEWFEKYGARRYGFHGISHQYCTDKIHEHLSSLDETTARLITCHLGSGCSVTAVKGRESIMTTMGYTPLEGLMMRTRSGSVDPGLPLQLVIDERLSAKDALNDLNKQSGLKAIFGKDGDMREIEKCLDESAGAKLAFEMFASSVACHVASLAIYIGGIDAISFTGGIGEHSSLVRAAVCEKLSFLGIKIDSKLNEEKSRDVQIISSEDSSAAVLVIKCREDVEIANQCGRLLPD